jgi:predicted RNA-binding protein
VEQKNRLVRAFRATGMSDRQIARELEVNKPLGREQRTINKKSKDIARERGLSVRNKLTEIKQEIDNGRAESRVQQAQLSGQMAVLLQNQDAVARLTTAELTTVSQNLLRLKVPKDYRAVFPNNRIIAGNSEFFRDNKGVIAMFLMSNIPVNRTPNQPIMSWNNRDGRYNPAGLLQIYQMGANRFLDMSERTIDDALSLLAKGQQPPANVPAGIPAGMPGAPDFDLFA